VIGQKVWDVVSDNRPSANLNTSSASVVPVRNRVFTAFTPMFYRLIDLACINMNTVGGNHQLAATQRLARSRRYS
jgi:hypothetical protein